MLVPCRFMGVSKFSIVGMTSLIWSLYARPVYDCKLLSRWIILQLVDAEEEKYFGSAFLKLWQCSYLCFISLNQLSQEKAAIGLAWLTFIAFWISWVLFFLPSSPLWLLLPSNSHISFFKFVCSQQTLFSIMKILCYMCITDVQWWQVTKQMPSTKVFGCFVLLCFLVIILHTYIRFLFNLHDFRQTASCSSNLACGYITFTFYLFF